ncbi:MAG: pantetheine-phosphate adenylyltransferase [Bacteroidales bacterium]|nr:pantetheine-phosphate adenylyltransferase [Bacteroidales bacterium]
MEKSSRVALFAGSFNPFTKGHARIVERALPLFDKLIIAIGVNPHKPQDDDEIARRKAAIELVYEGVEQVSVVTYSTLTAEYAKEVGAHWLLKGVRNVTDYEYEKQMADINRRLTGVETVLLYAEEAYASVSSSMVRELESFGYDISDYLPKK